MKSISNMSKMYQQGDNIIEILKELSLLLEKEKKSILFN